MSQSGEISLNIIIFGDTRFNHEILKYVSMPFLDDTWSKEFFDSEGELGMLTKRMVRCVRRTFYKDIMDVFPQAATFTFWGTHSP